MKQNKPISPYTQCRGCCKRIRLSWFKYCPDCSKLAYRLYQEHFSPKARKFFWAYYRKHGCRCCFSGMSLELDDDTSPWYLVFSRLDPGDKSKIVPASALVNAMKSFLLKKEFWYFIRQLANHYRKGSVVRKRKLAFWSRPYREENHGY